MLKAGDSRWRIARTLQSAYAGGLLSEETFLGRLDDVLNARVIDPRRIVGDLSFRSSHRGVRGRVVAAMHTLIGKLDSPPGGHRQLLALDWSGNQTELSVGRHLSCDVVFSDLTVSRRHATLIFRDGRWIVRDLESKNGTMVNGLRVGRCELRPGDRIALGDQQLVVD
jgi:hypothetical protein